MIEDREAARNKLEKLQNIKLTLKILRAELEAARDFPARCGCSEDRTDTGARKCCADGCESIEREILQDIARNEQAYDDILGAIDAIKEKVRGDWWLKEYLLFRYVDGMTNEQAAAALKLSSNYTRRGSVRALDLFAVSWNSKHHEEPAAAGAQMDTDNLAERSMQYQKNLC